MRTNSNALINNQKKEVTDTSLPVCDVVIVGAGPVGLYSAYELANKNKSILVLEKRSQKDAMLRPQVITLTPKTKELLVNMITEKDDLTDSDIKFLSSLKYFIEAKISSIQKFIFNRLQKFSKNVTINYESQLKEVNLAGGVAILNKIQNQNEQTFFLKFKHIIAADGARSETLELINENLKINKRETITKTTPFEMHYRSETYHLSAYIKIEIEKNMAHLNLPKNEFVIFVNDNIGDSQKYLTFLRIDKISFENNNHKKGKINFVAEIPKHLYDDLTKNDTSYQEKLRVGLKYIKDTIIYFYSLHPEINTPINNDTISINITESKSNKKKDELKLLAFRGDISKASSACKEINGHAFYLIGDSLFTPNYHLGHGINDGFSEAENIALLPINQSDPTFNDKILEHMSNYQELTDTFIRNIRIQTFGLRIARLLGDKEYQYFVNQTEELVDTYGKNSILNFHSLFNNGLDSNHHPFKKYINKIFEFDFENSIPDELNKKINEWITLLKTAPHFAKDYSFYIMEKLEKIRKEIYFRYKNNQADLTIKKFFDCYFEYKNILNVISENFLKMNKNQLNKMIDCENKSTTVKITPLYDALQQADDTTILKMIQNGADPYKISNNPIDSTIFCVDDRLFKDTHLTKMLIEDGKVNPFQSRLVCNKLFDNKEMEKYPAFIIMCILAFHDHPVWYSETIRGHSTEVIEKNLLFFRENLLDNTLHSMSKTDLYNLFENQPFSAEEISAFSDEEVSAFIDRLKNDINNYIQNMIVPTCASQEQGQELSSFSPNKEILALNETTNKEDKIISPRKNA